MVAAEARGPAPGPTRAGKVAGAEALMEGATPQACRMQDGMEVTVLQAAHAPSKSVLSVRSGLSRRQAKLELHKPFTLACPEPTNGTVEVTLFQQLASHLLPNQPEAVCNVPVRRPDGVASQVKLRVRRAGVANETTPQEALAAAKDYLEKHQLQQQIQSLIQDVLRDQPQDPYYYMLEQLRKGRSRQQEEAATPSAAPSLADGASSAGGGGGEAAKERPSRCLVRASLRAVLEGPQCQAAALSSLKEAVRKEAAAQLAAGTIDSYIQRWEADPAALSGGHRVAQAASLAPEPPVEEQAKFVVRLVLQNSAALTTPDYRRAVARWTVRCSVRGAANIIGEHPEMRRESFGEDAQAIAHKRMSLPMPIVYLSADTGSWGQWLAEPMEGSSSGRK